MLAHLLTRNGEALSLIIGEHYPEARQVLNSAKDTLASVMFNLGTYTADIIQLGRIHDCYDSKIPVYQATARALRSSAYLSFVTQDMVNDQLSDENETIRLKKTCYFKGVCLHLKRKLPNWQWNDFAEFVKQPIPDRMDVKCLKYASFPLS